MGQREDRERKPSPRKKSKWTSKPWNAPVPGYILASMGIFSDLVKAYTYEEDD